MSKIRKQIKQIANLCARSLTAKIRRFFPSVPILTQWPGFGVVMKGVHRRTSGPICERILMRAARYRRRHLSGILVVGITGSVGKTTTKDILAGILAKRYLAHKTNGTSNHPRDVARTVLFTPPKTNVCILELSGHRPGGLDGPLEVAQPRIAVVTNIGMDHISAFRSCDDIAKEKRKLVEAIPKDGIAILNADDDRVLQMQSFCAGRIITYGHSREAMLRADNVTSQWPQCLSFTATWGPESVAVRTRLHGAYWTGAVLAALAAAVGIGMSLPEAAKALTDVSPFQGRMNEVVLDGITFIRDDWKAPAWTFPAVFDFMESASARRKIFIFGTISDISGNASSTYANVAKRALSIADQVIFVGPNSFSALRAKGTGKGQLFAYSSVRAAYNHSNSYLEPGDLVLLKGSNTADHLLRILLGRTQPISCWRSDCGRDAFCDICALLNVPSEDADATASIAAEDTRNIVLEAGENAPRVVVGLGNPGIKYMHTPHNVGFAVLEKLAMSLASSWTTNIRAAICFTELDGKPLYIIKPNTHVNLTGSTLLALADELGFLPENCILVHDDLDLPLGAVRARIRGSAGGHRGVRSILESFQSDAFPRVKVGVRPARLHVAAEEYVLQPCSEPSLAILETAYDHAVDRILWLLRQGIPSQHAPQKG